MNDCAPKLVKELLTYFVVLSFAMHSLKGKRSAQRQLLNETLLLSRMNTTQKIVLNVILCNLCTDYIYLHK